MKTNTTVATSLLACLTAIFLSAPALAWTTTTPDFGDTEGHLSSRFFVSGSPWTKKHAVVYREGTLDDLKIATRTAPEGGSWSAWTVQTIDTDSVSGSAVSLAFDDNGNPVVAYIDANVNWSDGHIHIARWVGGGLGNCGSGTNWQCDVVANYLVGKDGGVSIAVVGNTTHIIAHDDQDKLTHYQQVNGGNWTSTYLDNQSIVYESSLVERWPLFGGASLPLLYRQAPGYSYPELRSKTFSVSAGTWSPIAVVYDPYLTDYSVHSITQAAFSSSRWGAYARQAVLGNDTDLIFTYPCSTTWCTEVASSAGDVGSFASLAVRATVADGLIEAGIGHVEFSGPSPQTRTVKWSKRVNGSWSTSSIAQGTEPSVVYDTKANKFIVSYIALPGKELKVSIE